MEEMEHVLEVSQYIAVIGGAISVVVGVFKFFGKLTSTLNKNSDSIESINKKLQNDNERIEDLQKSTKHMCILMAQLSNHMITGNDVDELKKTRDNILSYLERGGE